ncbi:serine/threonine protein kinase [Ornithinibacillus scapharcae]|uniref:serine/threonine protein kinase n=1 Tax=Ornithinibacillus scapharcae TaxID=1147159 RepID=UPI000225B36D|nr:protein kinase [Ornithinibacillus scapharcae]
MLRPIRKFQQFLVDHPLKAGEIIHHRYQVVDVIGKGSYGILYKCMDRETRDNIVIKQLRPSKRKKIKEINLFKKEAEIIGQLNHPNIPTFFEAFSEKEHYFYAMSLLEAENLEETIFARKKTFNEKESLLFMRELIEIINHIHEKKIYHLDLRIPNIMIQNDEPYLIDFGLASQGKMLLPIKEEDAKLQDFYDIGDILLYLLYTTYSPKKKKALPWTEELVLKKETVHLLKRLLRISEPYGTIEEIKQDIAVAIHSKEIV